MKIKGGFTLIEAMIAITLLGIIATIAIPSFRDSFERSKVRKTSDLIAEMISMSQSEALRRNSKIYFAVLTGHLCIGSAAGQCDIRDETISNGVSVNTTSLVLSPFYGVPTPTSALFTVSYYGVTQTVKVNRMGLITVGALQ